MLQAPRSPSSEQSGGEGDGGSGLGGSPSKWKEAAYMSVTAIRHTGIVVSDMKRELQFYRDLLGMTVWFDAQDDSEYVQSVTEVPSANIWMVKLKAMNGNSIELLQYLSHPQGIPEPMNSCDVGCNHIALQVEDIGAMYETLVSAGVRFHAPPTISSDGSAKVTYCRDPEGVIVELVEILNQSSFVDER